MVHMHQVELITASVAAKILGCSRWTVARLAADGTLPHKQKMSGATGAYLFGRRDVERLAAKRAKERAA